MLLSVICSVSMSRSYCLTANSCAGYLARISKTGWVGTQKQGWKGTSDLQVLLLAAALQLSLLKI